jgi:hypothetical protein
MILQNCSERDGGGGRRRRTTLRRLELEPIMAVEAIEQDREP